jgi:hypothetical protein
MGNVTLHLNSKLLGRFPSPHAAARWIVQHEPISITASGGDWALRVLRTWASSGGGSFVHEYDPAPPPTALYREAEHIRDGGWSG